MNTGSKWIVWIPSDLAYGDDGAGGAGIPGGATLEFEIELLEILR
jgi:FKBP-type peptidyl-prolyl cis-trans isomerase